MRPTAGYMFENADELESTRLTILNKTHNPHTLHFLAPFLKTLPVGSNVMELGCGTGLLAREVASELPAGATLHLVDRSEPQIKQASTNVTGLPNVQLHQLDVATQTDALRALGPMDLIYCRWLICHIPVAQQVEVVRNILQLLKPGGVFLMDDGDNSTVNYRAKRGGALPDYARNASTMFHETAKQIGAAFGIDLEFNADKQKALLEKAGADLGACETIDTYRLTLGTTEEKQLLSIPWKTGIAAVFKAKGLEITESAAKAFVAPSEACDEDDNVEADFLTETISVFRRKPFSKL